ncbi:MAG: ABC transporter ATP-binding protein [Candidatus Thermoplasmatota archaeon]|nr:ABC transporter ATP-binding protein [Candidatus Thermoplasmatota archaeon]
MGADPDLVIELNKLTKYYGKSRGIIDVDLSVRRGEVFGFLGPNGAGKSTAIRTILDLIRPTSGWARVNGMDPTKEGANVRRSVGYLPSDFGTYRSMTAKAYLRTLLEMMDHKGPDRINELAGRLDLDLKRRIKDFSRGNRQKIGVISAFMHNPKLVILDEPTTGLDPLMQQEFYRIVMEEKSKGNTVFLSSHILGEVEAICDRVGIIREGRLIMVENMSAFKRKTGKVLNVEFEKKVDPDIFMRLEGVSDIKVGGDNVLIMTVSSHIDGVIKELAKHTVIDLTYDEVSLEDLFLKYYGRENVNHKGNGKGVLP